MSAFRSKNIKAPIQDRISELQRKITLMEGARRAKFESSRCLIKENRETIMKLRHDNKLLHRKLAEVFAGDEQVIKEVFQSRSSEKATFKNMSLKEMMHVLDQKVSEKMKKLNTMKHVTNRQRQRLEELNNAYHTLRTKPDLLTARDITKLRLLENRVEEAQLKCQEAERITKSNRKLKEHLQEESLLFQPYLDELERDVIQQKQELRDLKLMNSNAHQAKGVSKAQLQSQKSLVYCERRMRKLILNQYEKLAKEQKAQTDKKERQRVMLRKEEEEKDKIITMFEKAFKRITEATGITDAQEVLNRFLSQCDTHTHLEQMKMQNELELQQLKEERDAVHTQYQDMKYTGETKQTHGRRMLEECVSQLQIVQQRRDAAKETLDKITHTLNTVSNAVKHLCVKLQHITLQNAPVKEEGVSHVPVLDMLRELELKLMQLLDELQRHITLTKEKESGAITKGEPPTTPHKKADKNKEGKDSKGGPRGAFNPTCLKRLGRLNETSSTNRKTCHRKCKH